MAGKSKQMKKLKDHHDYLSRKVAELTEDRKKIGVRKAKPC